MNPPYLQPYLDAAAHHGAGFETLLWASAESQAARFDAIVRAADLSERNILDLGCGRADLLKHLIDRGITPVDYTGIEALNTLVAAARARHLPNCRILQADFVVEPIKMFVAADVVIFCGSLNTLPPSAFFSSITHAFDATADTLIFNFLTSPLLAAREYLQWYKKDIVMQFAQQLTSRATLIDDYLDGDATIALRKEHA